MIEKNLLNQIKQTVVFIGRFQKDEDGRPKSFPIGTGFLVNIQGKLHLATAKHVVCRVDKTTGKAIEEREGLRVFLNGKGDANVLAYPLEELKKTGLNWYFHPDEKIDIAITPFPIDPNQADFKTIPVALFLPTAEVNEADDVFFLSYQPNISDIEKDNKISPIIRKDTVSRVIDSKTFYIDGFAFPGNSGSPVFMLPAAIRFAEQGISVGTDSLGGRFAGIIATYLPYQDYAISKQTGEPRIIFEENTGLSEVHSANCILEIIETDDYKRNMASKEISQQTEVV